MDINPKWQHAIDINVCPFCGKGIMEEHLKNSFMSLRQTMDQLDLYPNQLNDWMLSNHNYIKIDSPDLHLYMPKSYADEIRKQVEDEYLSDKKIQEKKKSSDKFTVKVKTDHGEEDVIAEKIQSEEANSEFFKRAEAIKPNIDGFKSTVEKTQHLKAMAQQIRREGATVINQSGVSSHLTPEMMEGADPDAVAEFQSLMSGNEISSALPDSGGDDEIPSVVLAMASRSKGTKDSSADLDKLRQQQVRVAESAKNFRSGSKGSFSRG